MKIVYNSIEVNILISYRKLRILLMDRGLKISNVCRACGLSTNVGTRINNDISIELKSLEAIRLFLNIIYYYHII